ncbi:hypothetical protein R1flu_016645 [Riccia fluitans]|uniref:non-specific serine/threonine protein kinase n=1 Tax=Riccia fluitans TaxID=41844 RepID=A0ABD1YQJ6_9MARC
MIPDREEATSGGSRIELTKSANRIGWTGYRVHAIRRSAAVEGYGSIAAGFSTAPAGRGAAAPSDNRNRMGGNAQEFMGWALPQLAKANLDTDAAVVALTALQEFLNIGDSAALERFAPTIFKACQSLLEDEGTSVTLLRPLLGVLVVLGYKFSWVVQPHFVDMVDLLLGWALESEVNEVDCRVITDSFVQFQKLWVGSLPFSMNLLLKFLGDMEVLAQDATPATPQQLKRLLALASCFVTVSQATTSGVLEADKAELITEPALEMLPRLMTCLDRAGRKLGDSSWTVIACQCMTIFAEFFKGKFADFYDSALQVLFLSLSPDTKSARRGCVVGLFNAPACIALQSQQVVSLLQVNLQLISAQGLELQASAISKLLDWDSPFSGLRLHSSRSVTALVATTYILLLQHGSPMVSHETSKSLKEEMEYLKCFLDHMTPSKSNEMRTKCSVGTISDAEAIALFRFDLTALTGSACLKNGFTLKSLGEKNLSACQSVDFADRQLKKAMDLKSFVLERLNPSCEPVQWYPGLQMLVVQALRRICSLILSLKVSGTYLKGRENESVGVDLLNECCTIIVPALHRNASLPMKLEVLDWISNLCEAVTLQKNLLTSFKMKGNHDQNGHYVMTRESASLKSSFLCSLFSAASHSEPKVRGRVATVFERLLQAEMVGPAQLQGLASVALEQLGDPDSGLQSAYRRVLAAVGPAALWMRGWIGHVPSMSNQACWMQTYPGKTSSQYLRPQQLVTILNYISQRWQNLPPSWLQRLVHNSPNLVKSGFAGVEEEERSKGDSSLSDSKLECGHDDTGYDSELLEMAYESNNLAAGWWAIQTGARHFITVRLRTHLGGPTQTFADLERMLVNAAQLFQSDSVQRDIASSLNSAVIQLLPTRLLLEFVEALEKNIYNAYEGSVILTAVPAASAPFFRTNKKVCEEWFVRIRDALMNLSVAIQCHTGTYHHASLKLQDLTALTATALRDPGRAQPSDNQLSLKVKVQQDVYRVLRHASLALCRVHESDSLLGLQMWAASTFGTLLTEDSSPLQKDIGPLSWMTGLGYQAHGQYELAAAHYTHLLESEEALSVMGADGVQFTIARIIESYGALGDWEALDSWLQELQLLRAKHAGKSYSGALTTAGNDMNAIHALARFDAGDVQGAWGYLDLTPQSSSELTADPRQALQRSEQMLLQAMLRRNNTEDAERDLATAKAMLEGALLVAALDGLSDAAPFMMQLECIRAYETTGFQDGPSTVGSDFTGSVTALPQVIEAPLDVLEQDCQQWLKLFRVYHTTLPESPVTLRLHQQLVRLARKQRNMRLARRLLRQTPSEQIFKGTTNLDRYILTGFKYERILLHYAEEKHEEAVVELWDFVRGSMCVHPRTDFQEAGNLIKGKACLKLSSWLQHRPAQVSATSLIPKLNLDIGNPYRPEDDHDQNEDSRLAEGSLNPSFSSVLHEIIGAGTKAATLLCPDMAKAWFSYASWCYDHAKSFLTGSSTFSEPLALGELLESELDTRGNILTGAVITRIVSHVLSKPGEDEVGLESNTNLENKVMRDKMPGLESLVQRLLFIMQNAAGATGVEDSDGESPGMILSMQLQQELQMHPLMSNPHEVGALVHRLMQVWWELRRKRVALFEHAARGFFKYLSMSNKEQPSCLSGHKCWSNRLKLKRADGVLSASLYVLRILLNYGVELEETLVQGLSSVPPSPWQALTAQLFARLSSHPEVKVRKQLEGLLMSLANVSPWAIVYPTLVDVNACEGQPSEELHRILSCLENLHPKLVKDVQVMIGELGAITVLWEEQWLCTLQDLHADVMRRISTLKEEAARVAENSTLSHAEKSRINAAKYSAMMAPIAVALERRLASTSRPPETPHELWFQEQFGGQLKTAIRNFKSPPSSSTSLGDAWRVLDTIAASFGNHQKKPSTFLSNISPRLAALRSSDAPMPGLEVRTSSFEAGASDMSSGLGDSNQTINHSGMVTITAFDEQVAILATKTKPKKLSMVGSDGERYTYLLKGREDLRLDARIMQLLHAVNGMLQAHSPTRKRGLSIRYYSVTPISGRAGLIQWVNNLTSMYGVFKSWQMRVQAAQPTSVGAMGAHNPPAVPRPSDLFYGKIIPALKEKGLKKVISRRDWPQEVKRKVLLELMKETPKQLLHRELWCASAGLRSFTSKQEKFSGSVAVMSMVGYILGLGDRHLDNILVDFYTGDVVHIDYNVCFDKGLRLKIPEIVPFRLTQTIQAALGLTGVEGVFRANCEAVLKALQNNKDLILMLLEVFVWDPLVEWMRGDGHDEATIGGEERKGMELAVSLSLFASRVQEIRVPLQEHHDQLLTTLPAVAQSLQSWTEAQDRYEHAMTASGHLEQNRFALAKNETAARALMSEASLALEKARLGHEGQAREFGQVKTLLTEAAMEMKQWVEKHSGVLNALRNGSAQELQAIGQLPSPVEGLSLISAVLSAGVPLTVVPEPAQIHCKEVDREVTQVMATRHEALLQASRALQAYSKALQSLLPQNYITSSDGHTWAQILRALVGKLSPDVLAAAKRQALDLVARGRGDHDEVIREKYEAVQMHVDQRWKEVGKLEAECAELEASVDVEAEKKAKDRLLTIFSKSLLSKGKSKKEDDFIGSAVNQTKQEESRDASVELSEKRAKVKYVLQTSVEALLTEIYESVCEVTAEGETFLSSGEEKAVENWKWCLPQLQIQAEKWALISELVTELHRLGSPLPSTFCEVVDWAESCRACIAGVADLSNQMVGLVLPETIKAARSHDPAVLEAFTSLSGLRYSVDLALEQVSVIEAQKSSLLDLEKSYPKKVEQISKRQAELEHNAAKSREHLSWEEAEELASEEEACRGELEELHRAWSQRESQKSAIARSEMNVQNALIAAEQRFNSLVVLDPEGDLHILRGKVLLAAFARLFAGLEPLDQVLSVYRNENVETGEEADLLNGGYPGLKSVRKSSTATGDKIFFVWKLRVMDTLLSSCIRDASSSEDMSMGLDQILNLYKKRLEIQLHHLLDQYLRERLGPVILNCVSRQKQLLNPLGSDGGDEGQQVKREEELVRRALRLIHEYCDAHEAVRATNSAVLVLKARVEDIRQALLKAHMEAAQMEWLHDTVLGRSTAPKNRSSLLGEQTGVAVLAWWSRREVLDSLQSSVSAITRANETLQACEVAGLSAEEQLDRAMAWACAGPSTSNALTSSSSRSLGIPSEFHEHLRRRRQLLWSGQEQAAGVMRLCAAVLEFEASREGFLTPYQKDMSVTCNASEGRPWQQTYQNLISRLESTCLSYTSSEVELHGAQRKAEAAASHLKKAQEELRMASLEVESALSELLAAKLELRGVTTEASAGVSAFCRVMRGHSALTVESGSMIEEVLAITDGAEGAHDVHSLAQEAFSEHKHLTSDLNTLNKLLVPLDPLLASAATAFARSTVRDPDIDPDGAGHSHPSFQSLLKAIKEAGPVVSRTVPGLISYVNRLHSSLTKLARTASSDAGVLHKALEGVGESQVARSQEVIADESHLVVKGVSSPEHGFVDTDTDDGPLGLISQSEELFLEDDDDYWISPPDSAVSTESYTARESASTQLRSEASQRLSAESGESVISNSEKLKFALAPPTPGRTDGQTGPENICSAEDGVEDGASTFSVVTTDALDGETTTAALISDREEKSRDLQVSVKSRRGMLDVSKSFKHSGAPQTPYAFISPGSHGDQARVPMNSSRQDHLPKQKGGFGSSSNHPANSDFPPWTNKEKNAYAVSVLKRVRMKLEGRDINGIRQLPVADHVDHLLRQATSIDNLCNILMRLEMVLQFLRELPDDSSETTKLYT